MQPPRVPGAEELSGFALDLAQHGVDPALAGPLGGLVAIVGGDFGITSGARTAEQQRALIAQGKTTTTPAMSRHVPCGGRGAEAVDLSAPWEALDRLGKATFGTEVKWGGNWRLPEPWHFYIELTRRPCGS